MSAVTHIILAVLVGLGVYLFQDARHDAAVSKLKQNHATAVTKAVEEARADERRYRKGVEDALSKAQKRLEAERVAADRTRRERDGLRDELAASRANLPNLTQPAIVQYAGALTDVLGQCLREYQELAQTADGLNNDRVTLRQAWPSGPK